MQIGIDHGSGDRTILFIQSSRQGSVARAKALQAALRSLGREASIGFCLHTVQTGDPVTLDEIPRVES